MSNEQNHRVDGALELRVVEKVFSRVALKWHLQVGRQLIATTAEHTFFAFEKGWIATQDLVPGDLLLTADGFWSRVDDLLTTREWLPVFNLRIADFHTYFVGSEWGWVVCGRTNGVATSSSTDLNHLERSVPMLRKRCE